MAENQQQKITIISKPIGIASDGNAINVQENGNVELIFFQIVQKLEHELQVQGVANIRMNIGQLEQFMRICNQAISEYKKKQEDKKSA